MSKRPGASTVSPPDSMASSVASLAEVMPVGELGEGAAAAEQHARKRVRAASATPPHSPAAAAADSTVSQRTLVAEPEEMAREREEEEEEGAGVLSSPARPASRGGSGVAQLTAEQRAQRRRENHNRVERRRRDTVNGAIEDLWHLMCDAADAASAATSTAAASVPDVVLQAARLQAQLATLKVRPSAISKVGLACNAAGVVVGPRGERDVLSATTMATKRIDKGRVLTMTVEYVRWLQARLDALEGRAASASSTPPRDASAHSPGGSASTSGAATPLVAPGDAAFPPPSDDVMEAANVLTFVLRNA